MPTAAAALFDKLLLNKELPAHVLLRPDLQIIVKSAWNAPTSTNAANQAVWLHTHAGGLACCLQGTFVEAKTVAEQL